MRVVKRLEPLLKRLALRTVPVRGNRLTGPLAGTGLRRVLIYRPQRFGDMLATLPILRALRRALPTCHLALWTSAQGRELLEPEQVVDEVRVCEGRAWNRPRGFGAESFDLVIDLVPHDSVNALLTCARAARHGILAGFGKDDLGRFYDWARAYPSPDLYAPYAGLGILELLETRPDAALFGLHHLKGERDFAERILGPGAGMIMINLSARHAWPTGAWRRLLDHLGERFDLPVMINAVGRDRPPAVDLCRARADRVRMVPEQATFREVACLTSRVTLLVSPDTSLVHVAALSGVPTVALFPRRHDFRLSWIPTGDHVRIVQASMPDTLEDIAVEDVCRAVDELYAAQPARSGFRR